MKLLRRSTLTTVAAGAALLAAVLAATPAPAQPGSPPVAAFSAAPNPAEPGETVTFDGSASRGDPQGSTIRSFEWDFDGDGDFELNSGPNPIATHAYVEPGTVTARLRVTDNENDIAETSLAVRVNAPPVAGFIYQPSSPVVNKRVVFSSTASDADGTIPANGYAWDFDNDDQFDDAFGETVTVSFAKAGRQKVRLQVTDSDGASTTAVRAIDIVGKQERLKLMKPFPTVRLSGAITSNGGTEIDLLSVRGPKGAKAVVKCKGRGCPFEQRKRKIKRRRVLFPEIEKRLAPGTVIKVFVTQRGRIGKYTRFKLRDGKVPKREDRCLNPVGRKPIDCPRG